MSSVAASPDQPAEPEGFVRHGSQDFSREVAESPIDRRLTEAPDEGMVQLFHRNAKNSQGSASRHFGCHSFTIRVCVASRTDPVQGRTGFAYAHDRGVRIRVDVSS